MQVHCVGRMGKKTPGEGRCTGICLFTTGKGQHVLCYHVAVVMQGLLPLPGQTPLEWEEMGSWAVHVTGMQGGIWGLSFQKQSEEASAPSYIGSWALVQVMEKTV